MSVPTRFGIIGLGFWGETILKALKGIDSAEIVSVASRNAQRAEEIAKKFEVKSACQSYGKLLQDPDVDVVVVATEEYRHTEPVIAALDAGKHVFLEKPIASNLEDADIIIQRAQSRKSIIMVGHIYRFDPRHAHAKELIERGRIGKVASFYAKHNVTQSNFKIYRRVPLPLVSSIHEFDLARWYLNDEPKEVYCARQNALGEEVADTYWITVKFMKGAIAAFQTVWLIVDTAPVWLDVQMEIVGTEGMITLDSRNQGITIWSKQGVEYPSDGLIPELRGVPHGMLRNELEYFIQCVQQGRKPDIVTLHDAREALRMAVIADESARTGQVVRM